MKRCLYYKKMEFTYYGEVISGGCILRRKPTECAGNKRRCWYPELLRKVGSVRAPEPANKMNKNA